MKPLSHFSRNLTLSLVTLVVLDLMVGYFIGTSYRLDGNSLERYFGYGFSVQNKLRSMVGTDDANAHPLTLAGWNPELPQRQPAKDPQCQKHYTFYGMSFSNRVAEVLAEQDSCVSLRLIAGPAAPLSHSYSEYQRFHKQDDAEVVVLAVLASSLTKQLSTAHFSAAFEAPGAHMYPRYRLENDELKAAMPPARNLEEFRELLHEDVGRLENFLAEYDEFYSPFIFGFPQLDKSVVFRMLRRAYGQSYKRNLVSENFADNGDLLDVSLAMLINAAQTAKQDDVQFLVMLINDRGHAESLDEAFATDLAAREVQFVSSTAAIDSRDVASFLPDGHFKPELDQRLARALQDSLSR